MNYLFAFCLCTLLGISTLLTIPQAHAQQRTPVNGGVWQNKAGLGGQYGGFENILIILDASYSMTESLRDGRQKMAVAKQVILQTLKSIPPNVNVGFRVYAFDDTMNERAACRSTQLMVPIGRNNRNLIASQMLDMKPIGAKTPISFSLSTAVSQDFVGLPGKKTIVLITDGAENCSADPCDVAVNMVRQGVDIKMDVVGFGLRDLDATKQLKCVAMATQGKYYTANTAAELGDSLRKSMNVQTEIQGRILTPSPSPSRPYGPSGGRN